MKNSSHPMHPQMRAGHAQGTPSGYDPPDHGHSSVTKRLKIKLLAIAPEQFVFPKIMPISNDMRQFLAAAVMAILATTASAQSTLELWEEDRTQVFAAADIDLADFVWQARPLVVFAQSPQDPLFIQQLDLLQERIAEMALRDVIIITDTDPDTPSALRTMLRPRAFMLTLIGKDGRTALRKPAPWDVRELSRTIDKMPLRQQEIRDRRTAPDR